MRILAHPGPGQFACTPPAKIENPAKRGPRPDFGRISNDRECRRNQIQDLEINQPKSGLILPALSGTSACETRKITYSGRFSASRAKISKNPIPLSKNLTILRKCKILKNRRQAWMSCEPTTIIYKIYIKIPD